MLPAESGRREASMPGNGACPKLSRGSHGNPLHGACCQPPAPSKSSPRSTSCKNGTSGTMPFPGNGSPALGHSCQCDLRSPGHVCVRRRKAGAFHRWTLRSPTTGSGKDQRHLSWRQPQKSATFTVSGVQDTWCLSSQPPTLPQAHTSVTLCHSNLGQAVSWAWTVFSNCRARRASGP